MTVVSLGTSVQSIPIFAAEIVKVEPLASIGKVDNFTKRVDFKDGTRLIKAELTVKATQTFLSGASLNVAINEKSLTPQVSWHGFENGRKTATYNVTAAMLDGQNSFDLVYVLAYGTLTGQQCVVDAELIVTTERDDFKPGVEVGKTTETGIGSKIGQGLREVAGWIVAIGFLGALAAGGAYYIKAKADHKI